MNIHNVEQFTAVTQPPTVKLEVNPEDPDIFVARAPDIDKNNQTRYYKYMEMIQSSGTGKSRTIDELSKSRLIIPMCLRPRDTIGYPYADDEVRDFLTVPRTEREAHIHAIAFLLALFEHTQTILLSEFHMMKNHSDVAASFREYMVSTRQSSSKRRKFFQTVVANAKNYVSECSSSCAADPTVRSVLIENMIDRIHSECTFLAFLIKLKYPSSIEGPILIISWDDAHALTDKVGTHSSWSHFIALRRVLHEINDLPIFSVFASTKKLVKDGDMFTDAASAQDDWKWWSKR